MPTPCAYRVILAVLIYLGTFVSFFALAGLALFGRGRFMGSFPNSNVVVYGLLGMMLASLFGGSLSLTMVFRAASLYWEDRHLAGSFVSYFILLWLLPLILVVVGIALLGAIGAGGGLRANNEPVAFGLMFGCAVIVSALAMFIWLLVLLNRLRQLIPASSGRASQED